MKLNELPKLTTTKKKRLGRGYGSGKGGHTASRGQKGQRSRNSIPAWFEGGQLPFIRRLPFIKGKNRFKSVGEQVVTINVGQLESLKAGDKVTVETLAKVGLVTAKQNAASVKILGRGKLTKALTLELPASKQAQEKIKAAGGKVELQQ